MFEFPSFSNESLNKEKNFEFPKIKENHEIMRALIEEKENLCFLINQSEDSHCPLSTIIENILYLIRSYKEKNIHKKVVVKCILIINSLVSDKNIGEISSQQIISLQGINIFLTILTENNVSPKIFKSLLKLCIEMIKIGKSKVQNSFYHFFITNNKSENFFRTLSEYLEKKKIRVKSFKTECLILEFIALLCEDHNILLQNYFRFQEKSLIKFNFIHRILKFIDFLANLKKFKVYKPLCLCFDALTELCQGPCKENQQAIIDSNFMSIISDLLSINECSPLLQTFKGLPERKKRFRNKQKMTG